MADESEPRTGAVQELLSGPGTRALNYACGALAVAGTLFVTARGEHSIAYRRLPAVHHVTGIFDAGSLTALAGPNGAGKSTLLKGLMGLVPLAGGAIDTGALSPRQFAYLPQVSEIDRSFPLALKAPFLKEESAC